MTQDLRTKPEIYVFINNRADLFSGQHVVSLALAEDGDVLAQHVSSSESWARHDMGITSDWKHDAYREHYPDGYNLFWCGPEDPRVEAAYQRNLEKHKAANDKSHRHPFLVDEGAAR